MYLNKHLTKGFKMCEYGEYKLKEAARATIKSMLQNGIVRVNFTKIDGTKRSMLCTLMEEHLPVKDESKVTKPRKQNEDVLSVFDLENNGWRSFRYDSIEDIVFGASVKKEFGAINDK